MFSFLRSLFATDPNKKLNKVLERKRKEAMELQRSGDLRSYAQAMKEISEIEDEILSEKKIVTNSPDIVDYDGMGNQGRFPVKNKKKS
tara:strand:+ start:71 stop:334 length:264 start_codon:yes stop_codon:yes gene_type:complete